MQQKTKTEIFIEKCIIVHGNKYDYSLIDYTDNKTYVKIICPIHGEFEQRPDVHLRGGNCKPCSLGIRKRKLILTQEQFLEKAREKHGDRYGYEPTIYVNAKQKVKILCKIHGEFDINPSKHLSGSGCPKCGIEIGHKKITWSNDEFISKAKITHGTRYGYEPTNYINAKTNVKIECFLHGIFEQNPQEHIQGSGCPRCANGKNALKNRLSDKEFINRCKIIHNNKYEYSNLNYRNANSRINILCPKHGEFEEIAYNHMVGKECEQCVNENGKDEFIKRSNEKHNYKYGYSKINYINSNVKVEIICPEHSSFWQKPSMHLLGYGCKSCAVEKMILNLQEFIDRCNIIHNFKYDYSLVKYIGSKIKVKIICPKHGIFEQIPNSHLQGAGCPKCVSSISEAEQEVNNFIKSLGLKTETTSNTIIGPKHLDIVVASHNIAIEYNGLFWHSEFNKSDKNYHLNKTLACEKLGIKLIHIFEDEWLHKKEIVKSRLLNLFNLTPNKIFARKTVIKEITFKEAKEFMNINHLQGSTNSTIRIGLFHGDILVSVMLFNRPRLGIGGKFDGYELVRFANIINTNVVGGASKLMKYFIKTYQPKEIISYADRRWSQGQLYQTLGFTELRLNKPNYWYIFDTKRKHRFGFRKDVLIKEGYDKNKTEHEIMLQRKIYRIYDCGTIAYQLLL